MSIFTSVGLHMLHMHGVRQLTVNGLSAQIKFHFHRRNSTRVRLRWQCVADLLGASGAEYKDRVLKSSILRNVDLIRLRHTISVLQKANISPRNILTNPEIILTTPFEIEQRHRSLVELGLHQVGILEIMSYDDLLQQCPNTLRLRGKLSADVNPMESLARASSDDLDLAAKLIHKYRDQKTPFLRHFRNILFRELLSRKLGCSVDRARDLLSKHGALNKRSLKYVRETINGLMDDLKFSPSVIMANDFLLLAKQTNVLLLLKTVLEPSPEQLLELVQRYPRLLTATIDHVTEANAIISEISLELIEKSGPVFLLWPRAITCHSRVLTLPAATTPTDYTSELLSFVYGPGRSWWHPMGPSKPVSRCSVRQRARSLLSSQSCDFMTAVANRLSCEPEEVERRLLLGNSLANVSQRTANYSRARQMLHLLLSERGFSVAQVMHALPLILHDRRTVVRHLDALPGSEHLQLFGDWPSHPYILQLLLYLVRASDAPRRSDTDTQRSVTKTHDDDGGGGGVVKEVSKTDNKSRESK